MLPTPCCTDFEQALSNITKLNPTFRRVLYMQMYFHRYHCRRFSVDGDRNSNSPRSRRHSGEQAERHCRPRVPMHATNHERTTPITKGPHQPLILAAAPRSCALKSERCASAPCWHRPEVASLGFRPIACMAEGSAAASRNPGPGVEPVYDTAHDEPLDSISTLRGLRRRRGC